MFSLAGEGSLMAKRREDEGPGIWAVARESLAPQRRLRLAHAAHAHAREEAPRCTVETLVDEIERALHIKRQVRANVSRIFKKDE